MKGRLAVFQCLGMCRFNMQMPHSTTSPTVISPSVICLSCAVAEMHTSGLLQRRRANIHWMCKNIRDRLTIFCTLIRWIQAKAITHYYYTTAVTQEEMWTKRGRGVTEGLYISCLIACSVLIFVRGLICFIAHYSHQLSIRGIMRLCTCKTWYANHADADNMFSIIYFIFYNKCKSVHVSLWTSVQNIIALF